ncbi:MAG: hypothetical protein GY861_22300 [bacterium]|nr:hypothetical protein [bacterium]
MTGNTKDIIETDEYIKRETSKPHAYSMNILYGELCKLGGKLLGIKLAQMKYTLEPDTVPNLIGGVLMLESATSEDEEKFISVCNSLRVLTEVQNSE